MWSQRLVCGLFANNVVSFAAIVGPTSRVFAANVGRQVPLFAGQPPDDCGPLQVLGHGKELESLGQSLGEPHVELLPSPENRSNHATIVNLSRACENQYGPHLAPQQTPCVMENVGPPDMREAALT
jgi:hypothetical protein